MTYPGPQLQPCEHATTRYRGLLPAASRRGTAWVTTGVTIAAVLVVMGATLVALTVVTRVGDGLRSKRIVHAAVDTAPEPGRMSIAGGGDIDQSQFLARLQELGVLVEDPLLAVRDGDAACTALTRGGNLAGAVDLVKKYNSHAGEVGAFITVVAALQELCPAASPFRPGDDESQGPLPVGSDGEFIARLRAIGLGVSDYSDAVGDAHTVCTVMADTANSARFLDAAKSVNNANPRITRPGAVVFTIIAMQVYCAPR